MLNRIIATMMTLFLLVSCGNNFDKSELELNNGEKWKVNVEMMPPIKASEQLVAEFTATDIEAYQRLAEKLKENNQQLISSCTMTGKSHNELHKWLHPYMASLKDLENAEETAEADLLLQQIKKSFLTFNQYFQ